ncbi:MAG: diaminopimelate epimerase [Rickettsiaceae bacterium]|nr:diaminopimelate epimerase [Rickettsiaceae bacterium]
MIPFTKMHGLGNDFIILDKTTIPDSIDIYNFARKFCKRPLGIGCDQLIIYQQVADGAIMEIYNPDGSPAGACGNATRCVAYLMYETYGSTECKIYVGTRSLYTYYKSMDNVSVNMGPVDYSPKWAPARNLLHEFLSPYIKENIEFMSVSIGNPHLIIFSQDISEQDIALIGPRIEKASFFPDGVNVNFAKIINGEIILKVWERGTGLTYACGSGACATFASALKLGYVKSNAKVRFELGALDICIKDEDIIMEGPVAIVAKGELCYEAK